MISRVLISAIYHFRSFYSHTTYFFKCKYILVKSISNNHNVVILIVEVYLQMNEIIEIVNKKRCSSHHVIKSEGHRVIRSILIIKMK